VSGRVLRDRAVGRPRGQQPKSKLREAAVRSSRFEDAAERCEMGVVRYVAAPRSCFSADHGREQDNEKVEMTRCPIEARAATYEFFFFEIALLRDWGRAFVIAESGQWSVVSGQFGGGFCFSTGHRPLATLRLSPDPCLLCSDLRPPASDLFPLLCASVSLWFHFIRRGHAGAWRSNFRNRSS